jgi:hypothetical protein
MKLRTLVIYVLLLQLPLGSSARAQEGIDLWRSFSERLAPGSFVVVHLRDGAHVEGRLVQVSGDSISILPKTRLPVPARTIRFGVVQSIDARKEGMSPGAKVLLGVGIAGGVILTLIAIAVPRT